ncbi:MAG: SDR family NAD(P)-dependent oxidoreductase [Lachnospiraceae bacterium]|nr:SDR family NAD(P)-dependent oxidoreductase [Lachnospiraceae bacterium]
MKHVTIAIVTGASSGMGREFVKLLDKEPVTLDEIWVIARRGERLKELAKEVHTKLVPIEADLSGSEASAVLGYMLKEKKPSVKFLINCAGFGKIGKINNLPLIDQLSMVKVNCLALTEMTGLVLPYMAKKSRIINLASAASFLPQPGFAVYAATKSYVLSFSRALNQELAHTNIRVTAVCPGPVKTEFFNLAEQTGTVPAYKKLVMADPVKVVKKAYRDSIAGKNISVYSGTMKAFHVLAKLIPHELILKFF